MANHRARFGPHNPGETYVGHGVAEQLVDLGEIQMNYATVGDAALPALLLIPGQTESWWGYEAATPLLHFDLAGFPVPRQLDALLTLTTIEHLHYGSDYPFTPEFAAAMASERLAEAGDPPGSVLDALRANTDRLFPALTDRR